MAEIGRWNGHTFTVSPDVIRGFTGLTIKGSCNTEDKKKNKADYVTRKSGKPIEVSITVNLNHALNVDVRGEAIAFVEEAMLGATDYFYVGTKKLVNCKLMLTDAQVKETIIPLGNTWLKADVQLTMKQADKYGRIDDSSSGKKKKGRKKKKNGGKGGKGGKGGSEKGNTGWYGFADHNELTKLNNWKTVTDASNTIKKYTTQANKNTQNVRNNRQKKYFSRKNNLLK